MKIGHGIKQVRKEAGLKQSTLARTAGVSQTYLSLVEGGDKSNPSFELVQRIAEACKVHPIVVYLSALEPTDIEGNHANFTFTKNHAIKLFKH